ncbi:MAG: VPDSG-CTERM sorting domain-containing protein [Verrucomicrobia bacterium]|nr:VPDSG-CTERM sorting domain-containing protein [Verrucomicrobiota bacterium]
MNVWEIDRRGNRIARQDQPARINVPDGGTSLVLLGMAMTGLAAANRRFRKS